MKKKSNVLIHKDHKLVTRRDFLAQGLTSAMGFAMAPSLLSLLNIKDVYGAENCLSSGLGGVKKTPVIIIDLAGGGNIAGSNVLVGNSVGQHSFISSYARLGMPDMYHPNNSGMVNSEFGLKFHSKSGMLQGMLQTTNTTVRQKCEGGVFCAISNDDTANNPHNPIYWLNKAGATGDIVQTAGTGTNRSGGRSQIPNLSYDPTIAPVPINSPTDCVELISLGRVHNLFDDEKAKKILKTIQYMSESKLASFGQKALPEQVKEVIECGFAKESIDLRVHNDNARYTATSIDPLQDANVLNVYTGINSSDNNIRNRQRREASMAKLVLDGYIGTGTIEMGGYDYHNRERAETDQKDREVGECIGRILSLANRKAQDVMIYVFSDGGVSTNMNETDAEGKYKFTSDDGQRASTFMLYYKHTGGRPTLKDSSSNFQTKHRQVGHFQDNASVEKAANLMSNNVTNLAKAIVLNYLALHGEEGNLENVVGDNPFSSQYDKYVIFGKNS